MATIVDQAKAQMAKSVESTKENFSGIRTGRANPALLNGITVDYYGAQPPSRRQRHSPDHAGADRRASQGIRQDCQGQG